MLAFQFVSSSTEQFGALNSCFCRLCAFFKGREKKKDEPTFCNNGEIMEDKTGTQISILSDEMKNCDVLGIPWLLGLPWYNLGAEGTVMLFGKTL